MPLIVYIFGRLDLLGHDIGQLTAHAHSTCLTILLNSQRLGKYGVDDFKAL